MQESLARTEESDLTTTRIMLIRLTHTQMPATRYRLCPHKTLGIDNG